MQREFTFGSRWLYYKIYCGVQTADIILREQLKEKIIILKDSKIIEKWFFIRYNDPEPHIRVRFLLSNNSNLNQLTEVLQESFDELLNQNLIWKIQSDTYSREIERYGASTYELTETLFEADSDLILDYLSLKCFFSNDTNALLFSFSAIDNFLNTFKLSNQEKVNLLDTMQLSFKAEFKANKILKKELDKHYRDLSNEIESVLNHKNQKYEPFLEIIELKASKIKDKVSIIINNLEVDISSYLISQIHMMVNRQYTSRQREYELIIYDHLYRYYKSKFYRNSL
jgi:thiopeptide-type bacteriocin biosynthesis protein